MGIKTDSSAGWLITATAGLMGSALLATDLAAQQAVLEEIVVTARTREEALMDVPLSITAFTELELERQNVYGMEDLAQWTPALQFQDVNGAFQNPAIRGLNQTDQSSPQGNVGVFIDGVPLSNRSGLEFGMLDVARILAQAPDRPAAVVAECDLADLERIREGLPALRHRRLSSQGPKPDGR